LEELPGTSEGEDEEKDVEVGGKGNRCRKEEGGGGKGREGQLCSLRPLI